jgi:hypothetical protein
MNPLVQLFANLLGTAVANVVQSQTALLAQIQFAVTLFERTPLQFTTQNALVMAGWRTMTVVADALLGIFIVIGTIQIMYGDTTGSLRMPVGQFVGKAILTAILIHLSALLGEQLLVLNNLLCGLVGVNVVQFVQGVNRGQFFNTGQQAVLSAVLTVVFGLSFVRVVFQAIKRIVRFNMLFALSGPALLTAFHPATTPVFSAWIRLYVVTIFEQFIQFLTFGLGVQFLIATKQTGLTGFLLAIAMLNMAAEIPKLLERFGAAAGSQGGGLGSLLSTAVKAAMLFA